MKKIIYTIIVCFAAATAAYSQAGFHFGLHGQYSSLWIQNQNNYEFSEMDYEYKYGPLFGVEFGYNWHEMFGLQLELNYGNMGQLYEDILREFSVIQHPENPNSNVKVLTTRDVDLNYLQIPLMFKYMQGERKDAIKYHMMGGFQFGYLLSANQVYTADRHAEGEMELVPNNEAPEGGVPEFKGSGGAVAQEDYFKAIDFGIILDIGVDIYINDKTYITPAFRGYYGLLDINADVTRNIQLAPLENPYKPSHTAFVGLNLGIHWMFPDVVVGGTKE